MASKIKHPVLLLAGENDRRAPMLEQVNIFNAIVGPKQMHVFKEVGHRYYHPTHIQWIKANELNLYGDPFK